MRWSVFALFSVLGALAAPQWASAETTYSVLMISRERLEVPTSCEIGLYIDGQLAGRLLQEQATSFNLPPGNVTIRLSLLPGQVPGCQPGMLTSPNQNLSLKAGDIVKYSIASGANGLYLKRAPMEY